MLSVFRNINRFAKKSRLLDFLAIFCAKYLVYVLAVVLVALAFVEKSWQLFFYPLISGLFSAFVISEVIYILYKEKRPATLGGTKVLIPVPKNPSFPSRHASLLFGGSFYLLFYNVPLGLIFIACSLLVGVARVFCGVHWFRDILAGAAIGLVSSLITISIINCIQ